MLTDAVRRRLRRLRALPLRWRLLLVSLGLVLVSLVATIALVSALLNRYLLNQAEQELRLYGASIADLQSELLESGGSPFPNGFTLRFIGPTGRQTFVLNAATEPHRQAAVPNLRPTDPLVTEGRVFTIGSVGDPDVDWLALAQPNSERTGTYVIALPLRSLHNTVDQFVWYSSGIGALALLACGGLGWFLVRRTFRPLTRIEDTAAAIAGGDLTQRVDVPPTHDEVASLSRSLNAMLTRIERSFAVREANEAKMRRFIADASHELRTPLAAVTGYAELYRQGALPNADAVSGAMGRIESEGHRMSGLVEDLLALARLDNERPLELQTVDLAVLAADAAQDARTISPDRAFTASGITGPIQPTELVADERQLRQVVTNLVTNARVHTPAGTPVEILVGRVNPARGGRAARVALHVRDHGHGIPESERGNVFERFYRADWSRSREHGGGNGLGLAIVHAIVTAHGGTVRVDETLSGGATFVVELPCEPPAGDAGQTLPDRTANS
ncbi:sensor histidine kinase [Terracoccus luteus]|uniref:histidine kinase n=1 Tax=Terracoccus luteus TaxID=53356 RepID=A0A839PRE0_9MICO|nr:HAMP domain-containing sensor histidine kinase [Terracoccus luteus]MBB2986077.1 two-component system OmpR family sensor kinase [Terracoccus luteus]MCP2171729.1 two-component system OmpR family sensor kinase [Terracoccus luteus]